MRAETVASSCQSFRISEASSFQTRLKENKQKLQELEVSTRESSLLGMLKTPNPQSCVAELTRFQKAVMCPLSQRTMTCSFGEQGLIGVVSDF